jgi:hypothetical protein
MAVNTMNSPASRQTSGLAITSFVLGLLGLCCPVFISSLAAVICGHIARGKIKKDEANLGGGGLALAGLILGYLSIALWIIGWIIWSMMAAKVVALGVDTINAQRIHSAVVQMASDGASKGDASLGWPADAGITTVTELKKRLVDNGYLTESEAGTLGFEKLDFGNVSESDPGETIFIKFRTELVPGASMYISKDGEEGAATKDDTSTTPARTPAFLAP